MDDSTRWRAVLRCTCPECGASVEDADQRFCVHCGATLIADSASAKPLWAILSSQERALRRARLEEAAAGHSPGASEARNRLADLDIIEGESAGIDALSRAYLTDTKHPSGAGHAEIRSLDDAYSLADDPTTPVETLSILATNWGDDVAAVVAGNRGAPVESLMRMSNLRDALGGPSVRMWLGIAGNPAAPAHLLTNALTMPGTVADAALANPAVPADAFFRALGTLVTGAHSGRFWAAAAAAAVNVACPDPLLELAAGSSVAALRAAVIANPAAPDEIRALAALAD